MMAEADVRRLFFALWPDAGVRARLAALAQRIPAERARVVHPDDVHLTLQFLGPVPETRIPCLIESADAVVADGSQASIELSLRRLGYWSRPRVLWCAPEMCPAPLGMLVQALGERLTRCGFTPERRAFAPHVTLARKCPGKLVQALEPMTPIPWTAAGFVLVESLSVARPPRYKVLHSWPL
jgi:2'-5' RNA ligase